MSWLNAIKDYKATWPYLVFTALVIGLPIAAWFGTYLTVYAVVDTFIFKTYGSSLRVPGFGSGDAGEGIAVTAGVVLGTVAALVVGFALYRWGLPYARKYGRITAERAATAAERAAEQLPAKPIGYTTSGEPIYPIVGYTPDGQPVTADRAVGLQAAPATGTNSMSIVALITGLTVAPLGIIFGHIALSQIKRTGQGGRGFAIAGLVLGYLSLLSLIAVIVVLLAMSSGVM